MLPLSTSIIDLRPAKEIFDRILDHLAFATFDGGMHCDWCPHLSLPRNETLFFDLEDARIEVAVRVVD